MGVLRESKGLHPTLRYRRERYRRWMILIIIVRMSMIVKTRMIIVLVVRMWDSIFERINHFDNQQSKIIEPSIPPLPLWVWYFYNMLLSAMVVVY